MLLNPIFWCWNVLILFWVINMFSNKRTIKRGAIGNRLAYTVPFFIAFWLLFRSAFHHRLHSTEFVVLPHFVVLNVLSLILTVLGLALAIWATVVLGRNWSGHVTFKENHELIMQGPYAFVRHPIYAALLLMFLGTALAIGTLGGLIGVPILFLSFWIKYQHEEAFMIQHFGDQYRAYMNRVKAILPFLF